MANSAGQVALTCGAAFMVRLTSDRAGPADAEPLDRRAQPALAAGVHLPGGDVARRPRPRGAGPTLGPRARVTESGERQRPEDAPHVGGYLRSLTLPARLWPLTQP